MQILAEQYQNSIDSG